MAYPNDLDPNAIYGALYRASPTRYPFPSDVCQWPLDAYWEDAEFRAGYPFSDIPEMESNGSSRSSNPSPASNNDVVQSGNSSDIGTSTAKKNDQLTESSVEEHEKQMEGRFQSCPIDESSGRSEIHSNQANNYNKEELDEEYLDDINDQVNIINVQKQ